MTPKQCLNRAWDFDRLGDEAQATELPDFPAEKKARFVAECREDAAYWRRRSDGEEGGEEL
jgi:hypothetical protein